MELPTLILAVIPPTLALAMEWLNPVSERLLRQNAEQDLQGYGGKNREHLIDDVTKFANGAVEVSGLAPTLVACVTSGFGTLYELRNPFWPTVAYVLIFITLTLLLLKFLLGQTFLQIDDRRMPISLFGRERTIPWTGTQLVSYFIYSANIVFIAFAVGTYLVLEWPWNHASAVHAQIS